MDLLQAPTPYRPAPIFLLLALAVPSLAAAQSLRVIDATGQERRCQLTERPKKLPSVADLVDSVALAQAVSGAGLTDTLTLSLMFDEAGHLGTVRAINTVVSAAGVIGAVQSGVRSQSESKPWAVRLRVTPGPAPSIRVQRSVYCPAIADNTLGSPDQGTTVRVETRGGSGMPVVGNGKVKIEAEVTLDARGQATNVDLRRPSGMRDLDDAFVTHLQALRYLPALVDGFPIASWYRTDGTRMRY